MIDFKDAQAHGLSKFEYDLMIEGLGRVPTITELGVFSVMWSEHCSYKTSKIHLTKLPSAGPAVLIGPGENAGAVDIGGGLAAIFKMESHNHPSFIEPFQGAATGLGGIMRDVFTMGARPVANLNALRFGGPSEKKTRHLLNGVVEGIAHYGNAMGVPTVGGEVYFDASFSSNILVNVFTIGVCKKDEIFLGVAEGVGNHVYYVGSRTGRDGIHGATMASETFEKGDEEKRPTVQVGDPYREKILLEACLELMQSGVVVGIQDMGAAGLTSSSVEMAHRAGNGITIDIDCVPQREEGMSAYELLLSESQERMLLVVKPCDHEKVKEVFDRWELAWAKIGEVRDSGIFEVFHKGERVCEIPIDLLNDAAPRYDRPTRAFVHPKRIQDAREVKELGRFIIAFLGRVNLCSRSKIYSRFDFMVGTATLKTPGVSDAAIIRTDSEEAANLALSVDCSSGKVFLDPREGAKHVVAECTRNLACVNARVLGATDCLNFGDPTDPEIMWQFVEAIEGMAEACRVLDTPIVGGNVSLYNASDGVSIFPTPSFAVVGAVDKSSNSISMGVKEAGELIVSIGRATDPRDLGASEFLWVQEASLGNHLPKIDLDEEKNLQFGLRELIDKGLLIAAHDCSEGGLGVALLEMLFTTGLGFEMEKSFEDRKDLFLFCETPSRILISLTKSNAKTVREYCVAHDIGFDLLGSVSADPFFVWQDVHVKIEDVEESWKAGLSELID